jgi:DNA (cytosine-5)-methyltransferase 1
MNAPGLIVDLFAGGGGASMGIEAALERPVDIAINHDRVAIAVHLANHPKTKHFKSDIWEVDPIEATGGRPVLFLHASPDCTHFSRAKGDVPRRQEIRSLADVVIVWAEKARPACITLENVPEFEQWGPLGADGKPIKERRGESFKAWKAKLEALGYVVEHRVLDASRYGAPTKRKRFFLVARCDGHPIRWPEPTHGEFPLKPLHTAAECIDWLRACPSIFERRRPLAKKTLACIAAGIERFVLNNPTTPFVITIDQKGSARAETSIDSPIPTIVTKARHCVVTPIVAGCGGRAGQSPATSGNAPIGTITGKNDRVLIAPTLVQTGYGERPGQRPRCLDLQEPIGTLVNGQKHALVAAFLAKHFGDPNRKTGGGLVIGSELTKPTGTVTARDHHSLAVASLVKFRGTSKSHKGAASVDEPMPTVTAGGTHVAEVRAFLATYYGSGSGKVGHSVAEPLRTVTTKHRFGLVVVEGAEYEITDIGMRMLEPEELKRAQFGRFASRCDLRAAKTKAGKVRLIGNSVCPEVEEAVAAAQLPIGESLARAA